MTNPDISIQKERKLEETKTNQKEHQAHQQKLYRESNKDKLSEKAREYYEENKIKINEYKKGWYEQNREAVIARVKAHSETNREQKLEYYKKRYEDKKEALSVKMTCPCGGCHSAMSKAKHFRTKLHKEYEAKNQ